MFFLGKSRLFHLAFDHLERLITWLYTKGIYVYPAEKRIEKEGLGFLPFRQAVETTNNIAVKIKRRIAPTNLVAFTVHDTQPCLEQGRKIFANNKIKFIDEVPFNIRKVQKSGIQAWLKNGHFNETGNLICAEVLTGRLKELTGF